MVLCYKKVVSRVVLNTVLMRTEDCSLWPYLNFPKHPKLCGGGKKNVFGTFSNLENHNFSFLF